MPRTDPRANVPLPPAELAERLRDDSFVIEHVEDAGGGVMGAKKLTISFQDNLRLAVKWKAAPAGAEGWNNSPRREIAAYAVQALFLDPADYPVPPVAGRAIALADYERIDPAASPTLAGTQCVFGAVAVWLRNTVVPERTFDPERLARDRAYAFHFANLNLLAYLIAHKDARSSNFLMSADPANPRVFSIDNGIAFGGVLYNFFTWHFDEIRTGGLPRQSIDRLRRVTPDDLAAHGVIGQWQADAEGVVRAVPLGPNLDPDVGTRVVEGGLQLGLTRKEIDAMATRLTDLLARIDAGELALF